MTDDNTKNYYPYKSNADLVKIECMEDYLEGVLWGTNNAYKYDIRPAQEEQKKDIDKALRLSSEHFKKDYINKATVTLDKINMLFREQITKALLIIEKMEREYSGLLKEILKEEESLQNRINTLHQIKATVLFSSIPQSSINIKPEGFFSSFFKKFRS